LQLRFSLSFYMLPNGLAKKRAGFGTHICQTSKELYYVENASF